MVADEAKNRLFPSNSKSTVLWEMYFFLKKNMRDMLNGSFVIVERQGLPLNGLAT